MSTLKEAIRAEFFTFCEYVASDAVSAEHREWLRPLMLATSDVLSPGPSLKSQVQLAAKVVSFQHEANDLAAAAQRIAQLAVLALKYERLFDRARHPAFLSLEE